jgi:hypothetical protein
MENDQEVGRAIVARAMYDMRPAAGWRTERGKVLSHAIDWDEAHPCHKVDAFEEADTVLAALEAAGHRIVRTYLLANTGDA